MKVHVKFPTWQFVEWLYDDLYVVQTLDDIIHLIKLDGSDRDLILEDSDESFGV